LMMSLWDALRMNMMISYQELVRTFPNSLAFSFSATGKQQLPHPPPAHRQPALTLSGCCNAIHKNSKQSLFTVTGDNPDMYLPQMSNPKFIHTTGPGYSVVLLNKSK
ncbi:hypothetical protein, partial [Escherichia coli]|uniref:hypothetical protein n=2 Tax=Escherichia coli TaxID=562 RepID=UPI003F8812C0